MLSVGSISLPQVVRASSRRKTEHRRGESRGGEPARRNSRETSSTLIWSAGSLSVARSCPTLRDTADGSLPGASVHGTFRQASRSGLPRPAPAAMYSQPFVFRTLIGHMYAAEHHSAIKTDTTESFMVRWMDLARVCHTE